MLRGFLFFIHAKRARRSTPFLSQHLSQGNFSERRKKFLLFPVLYYQKIFAGYSIPYACITHSFFLLFVDTKAMFLKLLSVMVAVLIRTPSFFFWHASEFRLTSTRSVMKLVLFVVEKSTDQFTIIFPRPHTYTNIPLVSIIKFKSCICKRK